MTADQVDRVYLAGGFANADRHPERDRIGLLAPVPVDRVVRVGNAALHGAAGAAPLVEPATRRPADAMVGRIEHVELETEADFFDMFVDGCRFVPIAA